MGTCIWCGKSAGFLRRKHRACQQLHDVNVLNMEHLVGEAATGQRSIFDVVSRLTALASEGWIDQRAEHSAAERG
jgi:hypothetical protein